MKNLNLSIIAPEVIVLAGCQQSDKYDKQGADFKKYRQKFKGKVAI